MSEYYLINDVHLSDRPPASCTDTYLDDLFDLLYQASARADGAAAIILAGDVFHHKAPGRTSHATVMRLIEWAKHSPAPVHAVAGNHDLSHDRLGSLDETQPLGVCYASGAIEPLNGWMDEDREVYGVPWLMTFDEANVSDALASYRDELLNAQIRVRHRLVVTHAPLYRPGQELKYEFFPAAAWAKAMGAYGTVHYGHVHEPHGIYQVDGVTFSNCGALSRGSLHEHNLTRMPQVAVWDSATGRIRHDTLKAKPADEVFHLEQAKENRSRTVNLNQFLESVQATHLDVTETGAVMDHVRATQTDKALVTVCEKLLTEAS